MVAKQRKKRSLFSRILGKEDDVDDLLEEIDDRLLSELEEEAESEEIDLFEEEKKLPVENRQGIENMQINLVDKGDELIAQALVPGLDENDIEVDLNREMLTISTESNEKHAETDGDYLYEEVMFGSFSRSILLPSEVEVEDSKAEVRDGILSISMPKIDKEAHKKLSVKKK